MIPQAFIQNLLARVDIVDVLGRYITLKKKGANYFACCPFHGEKTASFSVSPAKQFYHCFGCGVHGTAISFLMEYNGSSYVEAIKELAGQLGLPVPEERVAQGGGELKFDSLYACMEKAAKFYQEQLRLAPAAIDYLKQRGLSGAVVARFGIGFAPDRWQSLEAVFPDYHSKSLLEAGLVVESEEGRRYDRFRHRIMFPIHDQRARIIGFGGRVFDGGEPKYLNSPETPLFEKGRELYGLSFAQKSIRQKACVIIVEGYMDVVSLVQFGVENVVATLGTATTAQHIEKLLKQTKRIVFCFDGDAAGQKAAWRALETSLESMSDDAGFSFLFLPQNHDPDSFIREYGQAAFEAEVDRAMPFGRFLLQTLTEPFDLTLPDGRAQFVHHAKSYVLRIHAPLVRLQILKEIAVLAHMALEELEHAYGIERKYKKQTLSYASSRQPRRAPLGTTSILLDLILQHSAWVTRLPLAMIDSVSPEGRALLALADAISHGELSPRGGLGAIVEFFRQTEHAQLIDLSVKRINDAGEVQNNAEKVFEDILRSLHIQHLDQRIQNISVKLKTAVASQEDRIVLAALLQEKEALKRAGSKC